MKSSRNSENGNIESMEEEENLYSHLFGCGPGFQVAQIFVESVFDRHIDWTKIIKNTENYKRPLQELLQSEFKTTPHLMEIECYSAEKGYHMGVYMCLGQTPHGTVHSDTMPYTSFTSFSDIHIHLANYHKIFLFLGEGWHKIKQNAEQSACKNAIEHLKTYSDFSETIDKIQQKHNIFVKTAE
jgi:hypothetical protein